MAWLRGTKLSEPIYHYCDHGSENHIPKDATIIDLGPNHVVVLCHMCWHGVVGEVLKGIMTDAAKTVMHDLMVMPKGPQ
jgi:hypothetical protein